MTRPQTKDQETSTVLSSGRANQPSLAERIFRYKAFIVCLVLLVLGLLLLIASSSYPEQSLGEHLLRDMGIVLVTTGLVVFGADYITRKEFLAILSEELLPLRTEASAFRESTINEIQPLKRDVSSLMKKLLEEITPLRQSLPTLSDALDHVHNCISLGAAMSVMGIKQIHGERRKSNLLAHLERAQAGSEIKILGIIASEVNRVEVQELVKRKMKEGCKLKILCLNHESTFVKQRAAEEGRRYEEMKNEVHLANRRTLNFVQDRLTEEGIQPGQAEIRYYDSAPRYFLFITDSVMIVGFYLGKTRGAKGPHLELEVTQTGTGIATAFIEHFDSLWDSGTPPAAGV